MLFCIFFLSFDLSIFIGNGILIEQESGVCSWQMPFVGVFVFVFVVVAAVAVVVIVALSQYSTVQYSTVQYSN